MYFQTTDKDVNFSFFLYRVQLLVKKGVISIMTNIKWILAERTMFFFKPCILLLHAL